MKRWQRLILWQHYANRVWAGSQRIRARSQKFFADYLADFWHLPALTSAGTPDWQSARNLDPALVKAKPQ